MKDYRVRVAEMHSGYVWVKANSDKEAERLAAIEVECEFESTYDCFIVESEECDQC